MRRSAFAQGFCDDLRAHGLGEFHAHVTQSSQAHDPDEQYDASGGVPHHVPNQELERGDAGELSTEELESWVVRLEVGGEDGRSEERR